MKAYRVKQNPPFEPVILELETQDEVDAIFALINHIGLREAVGLRENVYELLEHFKGYKSEAKHVALMKVIKG